MLRGGSTTATRSRNVSRQLLIVVIFALAADTASVAAQCTVSVTEIQNVFGGRRFRAAVTADGPYSSVGMNVYDADGGNWGGGRNECAEPTCSFETELWCLPAGPLTVSGSGTSFSQTSSRSCETAPQQISGPSGSPALALSGEWHGEADEEYEIAVEYSIPIGDGADYIDLEYQDGEGVFVYLRRLTHSAQNEGVVTFSGPFQPGMFLRAKADRLCGGMTREGSLGYSGVLEVPPRQQERFVSLGDVTPGRVDQTFQQRLSGTQVQARVALGQVFWLGLAERRGTLETMQELVTLAAPLGNNFATEPDVVEENALYANEVLGAFAESTQTPKHYFVAAHIGTTKVLLTPLAGSGSAMIEVTVERPTQLGSTRPTWDPAIIRYAHRRGIPPQMIKGIIEQETNFNPTSYRYEPFTTDWDRFSYHCTRECWIDVEPYRRYRMETANGLPRGEAVSAEDLNQRNRLDIQREGDHAVRRLTAADQDVTAYELYLYNDYEDPSRDIRPRVDQNWFEILRRGARRTSIAERPAEVLDYNAQTTIAASYGLMQTMFTSAIQRARWPGDVDGNQNPSLLHDTPRNLDRGGGSLWPGTAILREAFKDNTQPVPASYTREHGPPPPEWVWPVRTIDHWEYMWKLAFSQYNGKSLHSRRPRPPYPDEAYPRTYRYLAPRPERVFQ